ncbi:MAG: family 20 glycosylhydrolase, partial [Rikenellaceae bacterium]
VSCEPDKTFYVATGAVMGNNTVCPSTEASYDLIDAVLTEIAEIFPFEYIHIGGDECNKKQWAAHEQCTHFKEEHGLADDHELQSYFIKRVEKIVNSKGRKLIGWDEILEGGLAPNATVMSWRGTAGGVKSAKLGHDVIMSPVKSNYLDLKQGQALSEPNLGYIQTLLSDAYNFVIAHEDLTPEEHKFILGTQANLWTETNSDLSKVKYMTFPRLLAVAENAWTPDSQKSWDGFIERLKSYMELMDFDGVRHAKSVFNPWVHHSADGKEVKFWFTSEITNPEIRFTLDGTDPKATSCLYKMGDSVTVTKTSTLKAAIFDGEKMLGNVITRHYPIHKAGGAKVIIRSEENPDGVVDENSELVNLAFGEFLESNNDGRWKMFSEDADIEIIFNEPTDITKVSVNAVRHTLWRWYAPKQIEIFATVNGEYTKIGDSGVMEKNIEKGRNMINNTVECPANQVSSIRLKISRLETIPMDYVPSVAGKGTLLNIDEIIVY